MEEFDILEFHAAVRLNDIGVALLQKGSYQDAVVTLKDAVSVMKDASTTPEDEQGHLKTISHPPREDSPEPKRASTLKKLDAAVRRLESLNLCSLAERENASFTLEAISDFQQACRHLLMGDASTSHHPSQTKVLFYVIYIQKQQDSPQDDPGLQPSILLYNLGIAYQIVLQLALCPIVPQEIMVSSNTLRQAAFRIHQLAFANLLNCTRPTNALPVLLVQWLVLEQLIRFETAASQNGQQLDCYYVSHRNSVWRALLFYAAMMEEQGAPSAGAA